MTDDEFETFLTDLSDDQVESLRRLRALIHDHTDGLDEAVNAGRWLKGFVFYSFSGQMIYAAGPKGTKKTSFHMMPFYGSPALRERHGEALSPFVTGKSCIAFRRISELPLEALTDIVERGTPVMKDMIEGHAEASRASSRSTEGKKTS